MGIPRNLGDPVDLRSTSPAGTIRQTKSQARGRGVWHPRERKTRAQGAVPPREGNGACGMDAGSLRPFIVPSESRETEPKEADEEEREGSGYGTVRGKHRGTQRPMNVSTKQQRRAELAKQQPEMRFTSLNHSLDVDWLREAYRRLRQASAPGYDGQRVQSVS